MKCIVMKCSVMNVYSTLVNYTALSYTLPYETVMYSTPHHCTVLTSITLRCFVLYYIYFTDHYNLNTEINEKPSQTISVTSQSENKKQNSKPKKRRYSEGKMYTLLYVPRSLMCSKSVMYLGLSLYGAIQILVPLHNLVETKESGEFSGKKIEIRNR
jgi:hypothetical protein